MERLFQKVIRQKIIDSQASALAKLTVREVWLPHMANKATAVIGMRRSGKSSLLWQLLAERHARGVARSGLLYFSFEDERLAGMRAQHLSLLLEEYYRLNPEWRDQRQATLLLDEIQLVPGWEQFIRRILDTEQLELFISGSSARLLSREVASSMRGRALEAVVTPFSFREYLRHNGRDISRPVLHKAQRSRLEQDLENYLLHGGFPEAQGLDGRTRQSLLRNYIDVVLLRDVIERHNLSQPQILRWMLQQLLANPAGRFSVHKFYADLKSRGLAIAKDSLHQLLAHLEDAFVIQTLRLASDSLRRQQVNPRKVYPADTALSYLYSGKVNWGHALETVVFHQLQRQGAELGYVRTAKGFEVDFYSRDPQGKTALIQVCTELGNSKVLMREVRALQDAALLYPEAELLLIGFNAPVDMALPDVITFIPAIEWLLEEK